MDPDAAGEPRLAELTLAWHRLDPWLDVVEGLRRLKPRFPIVNLSSGNVALILDMARRAGLPWDAVLGVEFSPGLQAAARHVPVATPVRGAAVSQRRERFPAGAD